MSSRSLAPGGGAVGGGARRARVSGGRRVACAVGRPELRAIRAAAPLRDRWCGPGSAGLRDAQERRGSRPEGRPDRRNMTSRGSELVSDSCFIIS